MNNAYYGKMDKQMMLYRRSVSSVLACVLVLMLSSCALIRQDGEPLAQINPDKIRLADGVKLSKDGWPDAKWWERYEDTQLNNLVTQAISSSPSMAVAHARIDTARAEASLVDASNGLMVGAVAMLNRQGTSENGFLGPYAKNLPALGLDGPWYTEGIVGLSATYSFDLWGKNRAQMTAALGVQNAKLAEAAEAELMLAARVTQTYFDIQTLYGALNLLKDARDIQTELVNAHMARAKQGLEPRTAIELARTNKLELDKQITVTEHQIRSLHETLRALIGAGSEASFLIKPHALPVHAGELPTSLGFELLARRPDLQAMRWYVQSSLSEIDAARAMFYPSFDIKAFIGLDSLHLSTLFDRSSRQINLIPGLSLPVFDSGRLNANLARNRANSNVTIALYNEAVVNAVKEIAQSSIELQSLQQQAQSQEAKVSATQFAANSAEAHYKQGLLDKMAAWEARLPVLFEQGQQLALQNRQINTEINLIIALGGGYQVEPSLNPEK